MEAIWGETMEAADELFAYGKHYFCNDSRLCWIINELLGVIWASRELVWWNILALYIHRLVKNTHSVGSWMLVFVWVCLRLSPDVDWLEITHPAERALFIFASTNPVFDDLYIACILLVKLDFLASAWASRRNLGQLPDAVSEMFILSIPVFIKWVIGYMPGTPNPLPDAEKPRPPAKDVERRNRRDNATQLNLGNVPDNALGRRSREGRGRRMWHITPTDLLDTTPTDLRDTTPGDRIADRDNPRCQCKPCHCINPAEPPQRNETRDQGTQTDPDHYGWRDGLNDGYRPPRWQLVCPYNPCRYNIINQGPESFLVDERNPTTPEGAKETDTVEEDEPRYETTPRETSSVTVAPAINLTDEALETDKPRSASPLDPRIPTNSYSTRHTAEIADSPKSRDVPEDTNDTQMEVTNDSPTKITNDSPIDHPPSEPESTAYIPQKASLPDEFQFGFELPMRWELRESQRGFDMDNSSQVHNQPYTPEALPRSIPTVDSPENSSVRKSRSLNDIAGSLQINKFNSPTTSAEVESCDIEMPGIQENINQQDSVKQEAQPGSPRDSGTRQADDFSGPLVLSQPPRLPGFPPAPRTSLPIKSKMYKPSDKGSGLKDLNDDPEDSREIPDDTGRAPEDTCGAPDDEDASEMEDNGPRARETIPTSPFDFESSDSDIYGYSGDDAQPNANTTVASSAIGQKLDTALDAILGTSEAKDRPRDRLSQVLDSDSNSEQSFEREGSPMESVHGEEGSLKEFVHDRESSPMDCDVEQVRDEDSMMGIEEGKRGRHPSQSHHYPRESELVGEYCRSDPDAELSIAELHDTIMGRRNSEEDHSIFDTKADTPGEAPQTADTDMVDSPSTPTQDFGNLDNICNNTQVAPPFTTQGQGFQQTAQAQGSDAFQNSNNGSRFTNMMDEIQGVDYSPGPVPPLSSAAHVQIPGLTLLSTPEQSMHPKASLTPSPTGILNSPSLVLSSPAPLPVSPVQPSPIGHSFHNTTAPDSNESMEVEVEDTATKPRKTEDEDEDEDEEEGEEDDIGDSVPAFDMEAIQHHAILDATMPLPSRQFPATDTASEHSDNDEPDADADPTPSGPRDRSTYAYVHEIPPAKESTQEEIAARPKLKLKPRFRGIQLSSPATLAGPSQEHHAESEHEEEERDPKRPYYGRNSQLLTMSEKGKQAKFDAEWAAKLEAEMVAELEAELNNDTQAGSSQQSDTTKQDVKGKRKAEEGFGPLADYDRLGATETWDSLDDDFLEQFRDPATPTPAPRPQSDQMETESPQDQQDTTPISGPSEKKPRKPFERERY